MVRRLLPRSVEPCREVDGASEQGPVLDRPSTRRTCLFQEDPQVRAYCPAEGRRHGGRNVRRPVRSCRSLRASQRVLQPVRHTPVVRFRASPQTSTVSPRLYRGLRRFRGGSLCSRACHYRCLAGERQFFGLHLRHRYEVLDAGVRRRR